MLQKTAFGFGPLFVSFDSTLLCIYESIYKDWYLSFWGMGMFTWRFSCLFPILGKFRMLFGDTIGLSFSSSLSFHTEA